MRCPSCSGLRTISYRNRDTDARCLDCRRGEIVRRETYWDWWLERFSAAECAAMARAIWGSGRHLELRDATDLSYGTRPKQDDDGAAEFCLDAVRDVSFQGVHRGVHHGSIRDTPCTPEPHS